MKTINVETLPYSEMKPGDVLRYNIKGSSDFGEIFEVTENNSSYIMLRRMLNLRSSIMHASRTDNGFSYSINPYDKEACFDRLLTDNGRLLKLGLSNVLLAIWLNLEEDLNSLLLELEI